MEDEHRYTNHYRHCGQEWSDNWSCMCNDHCPICNKEIEPYESEDNKEEETMTATNNGLLCIAAFISAGMHVDIERLDMAKESLDTGCIELVSAGVSYTDYLEALYAAGLELIGGVPGVFEYEVAEPFGTWYVDTILDSTVEPDLPDNDSVCAKLVGLVLTFYSNKDRASNKVDELFTALQAVPKPAMPQI